MKTKTITLLLLALVAVGGVAMVASNQNTIAKARAEHQALLAESEEAHRLAEENKDMTRLRAEGADLEKLRQENKELPKLRNDVRQLRRQAEELKKLQAENQRLQTQQKSGVSGHVQMPPGYITKSAMVDAGLGSPEAAMQTALWAMCHGNYKRLLECMTPEFALKMSNEDEESIRKHAAEREATFPGFRIAEKTEVSPDEVIIKFQVIDDENIRPVHLKRIGNEWKLSNDY